MSKISVDKILPNPEQPRKTFDQSEMVSLADSIRKHGLINPITVEQAGDCYILIDGERRWRAAKLAGMSQIDATIRPAMNGKGGQERLVLALVSNLQRSDLTTTEEARAYKKMKDAGMSNTAIANTVGRSIPYVLNLLSLLDLDDEIQSMIDAKQLPKDARIVEAFLSIRDKDVRLKFARRIAKNCPTIMTIVAASRKLNETMTAKKLEDPILELAEQRHGNKQPNPQWTALQQLKRLPPWPIVRKAAVDTCRKCVLRESANEKTCEECPAVEILSRMMDDNNGC